MRYLFVGGHWHGRVHEFPGSAPQHWNVVVQEPIQWTPNMDVLDYSSVTLHSYTLDAVYSGLMSLQVYVYNGLPRERPSDLGEWVFHALAQAAGLQTRWAYEG